MAIGNTNSFINVSEHMTLFSNGGEFTPRVGGKYRITAIGQGGDGFGAGDLVYTPQNDFTHSGACGGGGYIEVYLTGGVSYYVTIGLSASFSTLITATAGGNGTLTNHGTSGVATGTGVVPFTSNGTYGAINIVPPLIYNKPLFVSQGGRGNAGAWSMAISGGDGLFGNNGGDGGNCLDFPNLTYDPMTCKPLGGSRVKGCGDGGRGYGAKVYIGGSSSTAQLYIAGGGGGGGFGGGGGGCAVYHTYYGGNLYYCGYGGGGADACIMIERL